MLAERKVSELPTQETPEEGTALQLVTPSHPIWWREDRDIANIMG